MTQAARTPDVTPPFPLIEVEGDARTRGRQYGDKARARIEKSLAIYTPAFAANGLNWDDVRARARRMLAYIETYDADSAAEIGAIAQGAGCAVEDIVAINARTDLLYGAADRPDLQMPDLHDEGCTGAVALPEATANGDLIHGQTWDWRDECKHSVVVVAMKPDHGPATLNMMEAGTIARCGMNSAGAAITANFLRCDHDGDARGVPSPFMRRKMLRQTCFADALGTVLETKRSFSNNIMVSHRMGEAVNLETTPREVYWMTPTDGLMVHANHFVTPSARARVHDTGLGVSPDSLYRDRRLDRLLRARLGHITEAGMLAALRDDHGSPHAVNRPPARGPGGDSVSTVASVVMNVTRGRMWITPTPYQQDDTHEYALNT